MQTKGMLTLDEARNRLRRTIEEYVRLDAELRALENTNYRVCVFGSARIAQEDPLYDQVFHLARGLSERGVDVVTGGGPGLMEAANRGVLAALESRATSYGLPLDIPHLVEPANPHLDVRSAHHRFSSRLDEFMRLSHAVVVAPGGIGTLLELMYVWQLLQLRMATPRPFILLGRKYWTGLLEWVKQMPLEERLINPSDLECVSLVDTPQEALRIIDADRASFLPEAAVRMPEATLTIATEALAEELALENEVAVETLEELAVAA